MDRTGFLIFILAAFVGLSLVLFIFYKPTGDKTGAGVREGWSPTLGSGGVNAQVTDQYDNGVTVNPPPVGYVAPISDPTTTIKTVYVTQAPVSQPPYVAPTTTPTPTPAPAPAPVWTPPTPLAVIDYGFDYAERFRTRPVAVSPVLPLPGSGFGGGGANVRIDPAAGSGGVR